MAMKPQYFGDCHIRKWKYVGDHLGQPVEARWLVRANKCGYGMGPFQWTHWYHRVPASNNCSGIEQSEALTGRWPVYEYPDDPRDCEVENCRIVDDKAEPVTPDGCCEDFEEVEKCKERCMGLIANDETALSVDVGFYLDFEVDDVLGRPHGCPAFDDKPENWGNALNKCMLQKMSLCIK